MSTQITGYSDDIIDIEGDICDDFDCFYLCGGGQGDEKGGGRAGRRRLGAMAQLLPPSPTAPSALSTIDSRFS